MEAASSHPKTTATTKTCKKRRRYVSSSTVSHIGADIWLMICSHLEQSPQAVFRLLVASKPVFLAPSNQWWSEFYSRVVRYQSSLKHSNFISRLSFFENHTDKRQALGLVFGTHCHYCGARWGHTFIHPLMKRACAACLHENLVSNTDLEFRYGLLFSDFIETYSSRGGVILPPECFKTTTTTTSSAQAPPTTLQGHVYVYMWKPHMRKLLGIDFDALEVAQIKRKAAAQFLTSRIIRLSDAIQAKKYSKNAETPTISEKVSRLQWHNKLRKCSPVKPDKIWISGGATYACLKKGRLWWRPGFNPTRSRKIFHITFAAFRSGIRLGRLPARPKPKMFYCQSQQYLYGIK